jgi:hypothetical protein
MRNPQDLVREISLQKETVVLRGRTVRHWEVLLREAGEEVVGWRHQATRGREADGAGLRRAEHHFWQTGERFLESQMELLIATAFLEHLERVP